MNRPLVSILIPSYKPRHFDFALKSAIAQSYENLEIIVSDDCPDDGIATIVARYASSAPITYARNPEPDGIGGNNCRNCLALARGEYVKFLCDDDVLMPFAVQYMVEAFINYREMNPRLVLSERWFIDAENRYQGVNALSKEGVVDVTDFADARWMALRKTNRLGEFSTAMWRREDSFDPQGHPLWTNLDGHEVECLTDVAMWVNLARRGKVLYLGLPLSCFRQHGESNTTGGKIRHKQFTDWEIFVDHALSTGAISREEALVSYGELAATYRAFQGSVHELVPHAEAIEQKLAALQARAADA